MASTAMPARAMTRRRRWLSTLATAVALPAWAAGQDQLALEGQRKLQFAEVGAHMCDGYDLQWAQCPGLPDCGDCDPLDCKFGDWGPWENSEGCIGLRFRERPIETNNNECGKPCEGPTTQSEPFEEGSCATKEQACVWSKWTEWAPCASDTDQTMRFRSIEKQGNRLGTPCVGPTKQTRGCGQSHRNPAPCRFSSWSSWGTCSATCGEGRHSRHRKIAAPSSYGGEACNDATVQTEACNVKACHSQDCTLSHWSEWSSCRDNTYPQRYRSRNILVPPGGSGKPCDSDVVQTEGCDGVQAQDCELSDWADWAKCDKTCEGGQTHRERQLIAPNTEGAMCPAAPLSEVKACNEVPCHTDDDNCRLSAWEDWSSCSAHCGAGLQTRKRRVLQLARNGGRGCDGPLEELAHCMARDCTPNDCRWGEWFSWSTCTASCGGGLKHRSRVVEVTPEDGPFCRPNKKKEVAPCNTQPCREGCIDGQWDAWTEWTSCTATCGTAFRTRSRGVKIQPTTCGRNVTGPADDYEVCRALPKCEQGSSDDCTLADWGDWSACSNSCFGSHERTRFISSYAKSLGKACVDTPIRTVEPCNPARNETPPVHCKAKPVTDCVLNDWGSWSGCTASCGGGQRERKRTVKVPPANGGKPCEESTLVTSACNMEPCDNHTCVDCEWGQWSDWSDCSGCGGQRYRHRVIKQMPNYCGAPCSESAAKEVANCTSPCTKQLFCVWTDWSEADTCGGCGLSTKSRTRSLDFAEGYDDDYLFKGPEDGNCEGEQLKLEECPFIEDCKKPCTPKDCVLSTWSEWHHNPDNCTGLCERHRVVAELNNECGKPCDGLLHESKKCSMDCEMKNDCLLSNWGSWAECSASENGQHERVREVIQLPAHGGKPCSGPLREIRACNKMKIKSEPYRLSEWESWGSCSRSCGTGFQARSRKLLQPAAGEATRFEGPLVELHPCKVEDCEDAVDCQLSEWRDWSSCVLGQTTRSRSIDRQPANGGRSCQATLRETTTCERRPVDCHVSDWTPWDPCDRTCGGGQTHRERQVLQFPEHGGTPCPEDLIELRGCSAVECTHQNCEVGEWGDWGQCSTTCGAGQQMRNRLVLKLRDSQGFGCDEDLGETRDCRDNPQCQQQDCSWGKWSHWGECSTTCGGGQRTRNRTVDIPPSGGGKACSAQDSEEVGPCSTESCSDLLGCIDGKWSDWEAWSPCSVTCGGGQTFRKRKIMSSANFCGKEPTGSDSEMKFCNVWTECQKSVDCKFSDWGQWSDCTAPCNGVKRRVRRVEAYGGGKGKVCDGALEEYDPCNPGPKEPVPPSCTAGEPVDCKLGDWQSWGECSATCDGGERIRTREVVQQPMFGGKGCNSSVTELEECARNSCSGVTPEDCQLGDWEQWGECTKCAGHRKRFRKVVSHARHGGQSCGAFDHMEVGKCPRECDERVFCVWKDWDEWSDCTATCGNSSRKQRRRYLHLSTAKAIEKELPPAQDVMAKYSELQRKAKALHTSHFQELVLAFAGGCTSLVVVFLGVRLLNSARGMQARSGFIGLSVAMHGPTSDQSHLSLVEDGATYPTPSEMELPLVGPGWN